MNLGNFNRHVKLLCIMIGTVVIYFMNILFSCDFCKTYFNQSQIRLLC